MSAARDRFDAAILAHEHPAISLYHKRQNCRWISSGGA
jgi:hypothetical protein